MLCNRTKSRILNFVSAIVFASWLLPGMACAYLYTIKANVNLREGPGLDHKVIRRLDHNQTVILVKKNGRWIQVKTQTGQNGFIRKDMVSDIWIKIHKKERKLHVLKGEEIVKTYRISLCPFNPDKDKVKQGDGGTPEGRFFICDMLKNPSKAKYGARSMRLSYPNIEDARRGLRDQLISYETYLYIIKKIRLGQMPDQTTKLGGSIRMHGGGSREDWTLGCVALNDKDIIDLFDRIQFGTRVDVFKSFGIETEMNHPDYLNKKILNGAKSQLRHPSLYTSSASSIIRLSYPMGDISENEAVCTDIVIRALRNAGIDLQALIHEDALFNPERYKGHIQKINYHIDHRRTRNLQVYFGSHAMDLIGEGKFPRIKTIKSGDIVVMDTGINNGTIFDHIGIVDDRLDSKGNYKVINIWTTGCRTDSMSLIGNSYPEIAGHFRLTHPFDYY